MPFGTAWGDLVPPPLSNDLAFELGKDDPAAVSTHDNECVESQVNGDLPGGQGKKMFEWIRDKDNQGFLTFLGGGVAVVVTAIWAVYRHLDAKLTAAKAAAAPPQPSLQPIQIFG